MFRGLLPSFPRASNPTMAALPLGKTLFGNVFKSPYVDVLKLFAAEDWAHAEVRGDVEQAIDKDIGKRTFVLRGKTAACNFLALPRAGSPPLGVDGAFMYIQIRLTGQPFVLHVDVMNQDKFVIRLSFSNRYVMAKRAGTVLQLPSPELKETTGKWTVLCLDLAALMRAHLGARDGTYLCVKGVTACSSMALRAIVLSDTEYTPETLPRDFMFPTPNGFAWRDLHAWVDLPPLTTPHRPSGPFQPLHAPHTPDQVDLPPRPPPPAPLAVEGRRMAEPPVRVPLAPAQDPRILRAAELLHGVPPLPTPKAAAAAAAGAGAAMNADGNEPLLKLSRVLGYSGERPRLLVWLQEGDTILYAVAALLVIQELDSGKQRFLVGHTAHVCALSAALTSTLVASAQEGPLGLVRLWDRATCTPLALLQVHASDLQTLSLTADGSLLAAVGKDSRSRQLLAVWDTSKAMTNPSPPLLDARSMVHHIRGVAWVPSEKAPGTNRELEDPTLVSHGYENVRFWRLRRRKGGQGRKLHVCGMPLQHHEGEMFLDVAIDAARAGGGGEHGLLQRRMLVGSSSGKLFQVDVTTRSLEYVFQLHDAPINTVRLSALTTPTPNPTPQPQPPPQPSTLTPTPTRCCSRPALPSPARPTTPCACGPSTLPLTSSRPSTRGPSPRCVT